MSTADKARELLLAQVDQRVASVDAYVEAGKKRDALAQELAAAEAELVRAFDAMTKAGWTDRELRVLGLSAPGTAAKPRRRRAKSAPTPAVESAPATTATAADAS